MRVVAGKAKGRKLLAVPGDTTRPILDRVKVALFDMLRPRLERKTFLDLFAGSGGVGIEALSQGAARVTFVDLHPKAIETVRDNLKRTNLSEQAELKRLDAFAFLRNTNASFDFVYVAPPQYKGMWAEILQTIAERPDVVTPQGEIIVQIDPREYEALELTAFEERDQRRYGNTLLVFFTKR